MSNGATYSPACGTFTNGGTSPDFSGISASICYADVSKFPENGLTQLWNPARADMVIDYAYYRKLNPTAKGACSFERTKDGLIAQRTGNEDLLFDTTYETNTRILMSQILLSLPTHITTVVQTGAENLERNSVDTTTRMFMQIRSVLIARGLYMPFSMNVRNHSSTLQLGTN